MKTRIAVIAAALLLSGVFYWREMSTIAPEDAALMATAAGRFGVWFGGFLIAIAITAGIYLVAKGIARVLRPKG